MLVRIQVNARYHITQNSAHVKTGIHVIVAHERVWQGDIAGSVAVQYHDFGEYVANRHVVNQVAQRLLQRSELLSGKAVHQVNFLEFVDVEDLRVEVGQYVVYSQKELVEAGLVQNHVVKVSVRLLLPIYILRLVQHRRLFLNRRVHRSVRRPRIHKPVPIQIMTRPVHLTQCVVAYAVPLLHGVYYHRVVPHVHPGVGKQTLVVWTLRAVLFRHDRTRRNAYRPHSWDSLRALSLQFKSALYFRHRHRWTRVYMNIAINILYHLERKNN